MANQRMTTVESILEWTAYKDQIGFKLSSKYTIIESNFRTLSIWVAVWTFISNLTLNHFLTRVFILFLIRSLSNSSRTYFKRPVFDPCVNLNVNDLEHTLERGLSNFGTQWTQIPLHGCTILKHSSKLYQRTCGPWVRNKP